MADINTNVDICASSGNDDIVQEPELQREQQLNLNLIEEMEMNGGSEQRLAKRGRQEDEEIVEEDGFVTVVRRHKRTNRKDSTRDNLMEESSGNSEEKYTCICVTGKEILPKQFGMAKLLRSLKIENIVKMVYKSAFRVLIYFENKESALELLNCETFISSGYRVQRTDEASLCYGILRQIDLGTEETEILENLSCEHDIISIRRLKRMSESGEWIDSETIRICFKGATLPPYVFGYGCRFKVEPYTFPVSQCSGCWKFGHLSRSCPIRKIICPKCGENHSNCETNNYVCVKCKGPHMAMYKKCPSFLKEKEIRDIMTKQNYTYRKALELYLKENGSKKTSIDKGEIEKNSNNINSQDSNKQKNQKTFRDILVSGRMVNNSSNMMLNNVTDEKNSKRNVRQQEHVSKKQTMETRVPDECSLGDDNLLSPPTCEAIYIDKEKNPDGAENSSARSDFFSTFQRVKDICISETDWNTKLKQLGKLAVEILGRLIVKVLKTDDIYNKFISSMFNNG